MASNDAENKDEKKKRKRRWGEAKPSEEASPPPAPPAPAPPAAKANVLAMQDSIRARLAAAKAKLNKNKREAPLATTTTVDEPNQAKRAKHFELDLSVTVPTFQKNVALVPEKPKLNPYLAHQLEKKKEHDDDILDDRLERASKPRQRHRELNFHEPGHWQEVAERKREKAALAEASGYVSGRKAGHTIHSTSLAQVYGRSEEQEEDDDGCLPPPKHADPSTRMPLCMEWWDTELVPSNLKKEVAAMEAKALTQRTKAALEHLGKESDEGDGENDHSELQKACFDQAALTFSKTATLVQHIVSVKPPNELKKVEQTPVLHLTKKERKRQRKLRRQEKQSELQDMQSAGLVPAPEPRLTLKNFIQVLGDQAFLDPSQMEQKVTEQMQKRQQAHIERNQANKLTKEQRSEKKARKLKEDTTMGVTVALFHVLDMSHPYHRAKVDLNAQQNNISGGVLECQNPPMACVICEGGPKAIKRYRRLMEVRMKWTGPDDEPDDDEEEEEEELDEDGEKIVHKFNPDNKCELVWQGNATRRLFKGFVFQSCETADQARKVLKTKGIPQYWDQVLAHAKGGSDGLQFKLMGGDEDIGMGDDPYAVKEEDDEDVVMKDSS
jgi:hypothetical protein